MLASEYKKKLITPMCCYTKIWQNISLQSPQNEYTVTPLLKASMKFAEFSYLHA